MSERSDEMKCQTTKYRQIIASLSAAGGAFAVGAALGWPSPASTQLVQRDDPDYFPISDEEFGGVASIITIGALISCLPVGVLMKKFGRKKTMLSLVVPFLIGWSLVIWANSVTMMIVGRFIIGLAGGAFCVSAPQYSAEIAESEVRGLVGTFFQLLIIAGILFVYIVGAFLPIYNVSLICGSIPLVFGLIFSFMPESPVYLVQNQRENEAIMSYKWLRGQTYDPQKEIDELKADIAASESSQVSLREVFARKSTQRAMFIGFGLMAFQQLSAINVVVFYISSIFAAAKTTLDSDICTIIVGSVHLFATLLGSLLVDKAGRKILLMLSIIVMTLMLITLGTFFYISDHSPELADSIGWLPLASLCVYLIFFAIGFGPIPWLMLSEVYSKEYNAIASPITGAFNWGLAFIITLTFGSISKAIGIGETFWGFAVLSVIGTVFTFIFVPETKGKSISDIQRILNGDKM